MITISSNRNLQRAKNDDYDEFYTLYSDIEKEMSNYDFYDKIVYCPCDNPIKSNFWKYFVDHYEELGIKQLISTYYGSSTVTGYTQGKVETAEFGIGDIMSEDFLTLLRQVDIVVTNPPFSLINTFLRILLERKKRFIILGPLNALKYKDIFPFVVKEELWLGVNFGTTYFEVPDAIDRDNLIIKDNVRFAKFGNICWYTNLDNKRRRKFLSTGSEDSYTTYSSYNAIDIPSYKKIPEELEGLAGVPITFMQYHCPEQYTIVGELNHGQDNEYDFAVPKVGDKVLFPRIVIRKSEKKLREDDEEFKRECHDIMFEHSDFSVSNIIGVDYENGNMLIKERFRRTVSYDDFTLRFSREDHSAEFNLIRKVCRTQERPFYYIYACVSNRNVDKFVVVHLNELMQYIRRGMISLEDLQPYRSRIRNNQFFPGMIENADHSSVFLTFSVPALVSICPECLVTQEGFL